LYLARTGATRPAGRLPLLPARARVTVPERWRDHGAALLGEPMGKLLVVVGVLALAMGLLWIGQGTGVIQWPASSFMISQTQWAWYGAALTVVGLILIWRGRMNS
jgi:hypothetical protein